MSMKTTWTKKKFGEAVRSARTVVPKQSQQELAMKINRILGGTNREFGQKMISRLECGDASLTISRAEFDAICTAVGLSLEDPDAIYQALTLAAEVDNIAKIEVMPGGQLECDPQSQSVMSHLGKYHCVFYSTDSANPSHVRGVLNLEVDERNSKRCSARFAIVKENGRIIKKYSGIFMINRNYNMWHCILIGHEQQEVCMLTAPLFNATIRKNQFNIVLALTVSAGVQKRPTVHRMIISRNKLKGDRLRVILAQLRLNTDKILISEDALDALSISVESGEKDELKKKVLTECIDLIKQQGKKIMYYRLDESLLYDSEKIDADAKTKGWAVSEIRAFTDNEYYNKISQTVHKICTDIADIQ